MAHHQHRDRQVPKLQTILKMVFSSAQPSLHTDQDVEVVEDGDEPPDHRHIRPIYAKSPPAMAEKKESLLTRALRSPDLHPVDRARKVTYPASNTSGPSTAELTSDGDLTSPAYSNTSSPPPHPPTFQLATPAMEPTIVSPPSDPNESRVEADLGRKRCISFACTRQPARPKETEKKTTTPPSENNAAAAATAAAPPPQRKTTLTFACPARQTESKPSYKRTSSYVSRSSRSPPPTSRRPSQDPSNKNNAAVPAAEPASAAPSNKKPGGFHMTGLGDFKPSEETRFHEFASSPDEVDEWVAQSTENHQRKITLADCMKKEMAIRQLGEEAEAEAIAEEEEEEEEDEEDKEEDDDDELEEDDADADSLYGSSNGGNESDNEAGFADSDDESDGDSEYEFWAPSTTTAATSADNLDLVRLAAERRNSNTSIDSLKHEESQSRSSPVRSKSKSRRAAINIPAAHTLDLPDSTDFVCGTLDEDRPLEAAYWSCIEERRRKKHVPIPQDIDPSFPTTDPEDNEDDLEEGEAENEVAAAQIEEELRGRSKGTTKKTSRTSPRRLVSPPPAPRAHAHISPKRAKSPAPPKVRHAPPSGLPSIKIPAPAAGINITGPVQRPYYTRTKSLPRTPNPFFKTLEGSRHYSQDSSAGAVSRGRELHARGPIDIIQGLERKRQKRKEKFWRQHCRKAAAKEQSERRAARGKGAERMKELGLEVAERFKAYGVSKDTQLMLSV